MRKLNTNKTQILHRIRLRKYNPEKLPEVNFEGAQWLIDDNIVMPQDDLYTIAWEAEFGGHLFDIPIINTDPSAIDSDESYTQGADTVIVPRSHFYDSSDGQDWETCPTSDSSVVHPSNIKSHGQSQDIETVTDQRYNDTSEHKTEPSTDFDTAYEPMPQPQSRQSDNPSTIEINDPATEVIPQNEPSHPRGGKYNLTPKPKPNYSEIYRY